MYSWLEVIDIQPGETPQPFHYDDQFCRVPRPRQPFSMATVWALDDNFKAENGATVVVPKSHLWDDRRPEKMEVDWSWVLVMHFWQWNGCFCCNFFRAQ